MVIYIWLTFHGWCHRSFWVRIKTIFLSSNTEASSIDYSGQVNHPLK